MSDITLRDYLAAHAPVEPWGWFEPVVAPEPQRNSKEVVVNIEGFLPYTSHEPCNEWNDWFKERRRQIQLQWPYFYADEMLKVRGK